MTAYFEDNRPLSEKVEPVLGAVAGLAAYVVGLFLTLLLIFIDTGVEETSEGTFEFSGKIFYNAMFVDIDVGSGGFPGASDSYNYLTGNGSVEFLTLPAVLYHLVPVLVLVGAGIFIAMTLEETDLVHAAVLGATAVIGFGVLAVLGTFLFSSEFGSPDFVTGVLLAGIVYPVVFGAIGGGIGSQL